MGMSTGGNKGGVSSEINVTPLIDVLLVLLIIFLVIMPIMLKMETLNIPRKLNDTEIPSSDAVMYTVKVKATGDVVINDGNSDTQIQPSQLYDFLEPKIKTANDKVVFVDFEDGVLWSMVVDKMDTIRRIATDKNHDEVKVALKLHEADQTEAQ